VAGAFLSYASFAQAVVMVNDVHTVNVKADGATYVDATGYGVSGNSAVKTNLQMEDGTEVELHGGSTSTAHGIENAELHANVNATAGLENAEFHIDFSGDGEGASKNDIDDADKVSTSDDLQSFVKFSATHDVHVKNVDFTQGKVEVAYEEPAELFGFINTSVTADTTVDADGSVTVQYPWYNIFMKNHVDQASLKADIAAKVAAEQKVSKTVRIAHRFALLVKALADARVSGEASMNGSVQY